MFSDISLIDKRNKAFRNCFFFFFVVAICSYLSLLVSGCPFRDDFYRYLDNSSVGSPDNGRFVACMLELSTYMSGITTDIAPLSQLLSCTFLAYTAAITLKTMDVNLYDRWKIACFIPIIVNPYVLQIMMFRFDNLFITLSLLMVTLSAYLSVRFPEKYILHRITLLLLSLFTYQAGLFAYFTFFLYIIIRDLRYGETIVPILYKMRSWILTMLGTCLCYLPFLSNIAYFRGNCGNIFISPFDSKSLELIFSNISRYFSIIYADWSTNVAGIIFFALLSIFILNNVFSTVKNAKSIMNVVWVIICLLAFLLSPMGLCLLLQSLDYSTEHVIIRMMYTVGILISLILFDNSFSLRKRKIFRTLHNCIVLCFCIWNMIFSNSLGNIISHFRILEEEVFRDIANDISEMIENNPKIQTITINGAVYSEAMTNFAKTYPIARKIIPEFWGLLDYSRIGVQNPNFGKFLLKSKMFYQPLNFEKNNIHKKLLKKHMWYDLFTYGDDILQIALRHQPLDKKCATSVVLIINKN